MHELVSLVIFIVSTSQVIGDQEPGRDAAYFEVGDVIETPARPFSAGDHATVLRAERER